MNRKGFVISTTLYSIFGIMLITVFYILYMLSNNRMVLLSNINDLKSELETETRRNINITLFIDKSMTRDDILNYINTNYTDNQNINLNLILMNATTNRLFKYNTIKPTADSSIYSYVGVIYDTLVFKNDKASTNSKKYGFYNYNDTEKRYTIKHDSINNRVILNSCNINTSNEKIICFSGYSDTPPAGSTGNHGYFYSYYQVYNYHQNLIDGLNLSFVKNLKWDRNCEYINGGYRNCDPEKPTEFANIESLYENSPEINKTSSIYNNTKVLEAFSEDEENIIKTNSAASLCSEGYCSATNNFDISYEVMKDNNYKIRGFEDSNQNQYTLINIHNKFASSAWDYNYYVLSYRYDTNYNFGINEELNGDSTITDYDNEYVFVVTNPSSTICTANEALTTKLNAYSGIEYYGKCTNPIGNIATPHDLTTETYNNILEEIFSNNVGLTRK